MRAMLRAWLIALSLANLCLFSAWSQLLPGSPAHYFMPQPPSAPMLAVAMANVGALSVIFWAGRRTAHRWGGRLGAALARGLFLLVFAAAAYIVWQQLATSCQLFGRRWPPTDRERLLLAAPMLLMLLAAVHWRRQVLRAAVVLVLCISPFIAVTFSQTARALLSHDWGFATFAPAPSLPPKPATTGRPKRVLWVIFDELDQRLVFAERPPGLQLPELDRLRRQALYATDAYPPARTTLLALPALISGRPVQAAHPLGPQELRLTFADTGESARWGEQPSIFFKWRAAGFTTAAVGFYHPLCRVFAGELAACFGQAERIMSWRFMSEMTPYEIALGQLTWSIDALPFSTRWRLSERLLGSLSAIEQKRAAYAVNEYRVMMAAVSNAVGERALERVLLHLAVPHPPVIYDRFAAALTESGGGSYLDNLALADRTLGEIRRLLEQQGSWNETVLLVTSDHSYRVTSWRPWQSDREHGAIGRKPDRRVPFLLKLPGQDVPLTYTRPFNTIASHELLLALDHGIGTPAEVVAWLDAHAEQQR